MIEIIVSILQYFSWRWVAFLYNDDTYGSDGQKLFIERIKDTEICLAYTHDLSDYPFSEIFNQINAHSIGVIVVYTPEWTAEDLISSAIELNVTDKVWIAGEAWSLNKKLPKKKGIKNIGTVIGVSQPVILIPGFNDFIYSAKSQMRCGNAERMFCNQECNCSSPTAEDIIATDPSYSFQLYAAVYAIAHALHNTLQCGVDKCNDNITVTPHMVSIEITSLFVVVSTIKLSASYSRVLSSI